MNRFVLLFLIATFSIPSIAIEGMAVLDRQQAILATQYAQDKFKALDEDEDYSSDLEEFRSLDASRQSIAEKLQKEAETLSQDEIVDLQREFQEVTKELEFIGGKLQSARQATVESIATDLNQSFSKIISELVQAKQITVLLPREATLYIAPAVDITDDVTSLMDVAAQSE